MFFLVRFHCKARKHISKKTRLSFQTASTVSAQKKPNASFLFRGWYSCISDLLVPWLFLLTAKPKKSQKTVRGVRCLGTTTISSLLRFFFATYGEKRHNKNTWITDLQGVVWMSRELFGECVLNPSQDATNVGPTKHPEMPNFIDTLPSIAGVEKHTN